MRTTIKIAAQRGDAVRREAEIRRRASWEHGTNEHINGLIRWYLPKGTDFSKISEEQISQIESLINNRPRKCLGFKTPIEVASSFVALRG